MGVFRQGIALHILHTRYNEPGVGRLGLQGTGQARHFNFSLRIGEGAGFQRHGKLAIAGIQRIRAQKLRRHLSGSQDTVLIKVHRHGPVRLCHTVHRIGVHLGTVRHRENHDGAVFRCTCHSCRESIRFSFLKRLGAGHRSCSVGLAGDCSCHNVKVVKEGQRFTYDRTHKCHNAINRQISLPVAPLILTGRPVFIKLRADRVQHIALSGRNSVKPVVIRNRITASIVAAVVKACIGGKCDCGQHSQHERKNEDHAEYALSGFHFLHRSFALYWDMDAW